MSFWTVLKKVGSAVVGIEPVAAKIAELTFPQFAAPIAMLDNLVLKLHASVITTEAANPVDGKGALKASVVNADLDSYITTMNAGLALAGKRVMDDQTLRQAAIDATVAGYNATAAWKQSLKVVDIPKP